MAPWSESEMNEDKLEIYVTMAVPALCGKQKSMEALMMTIHAVILLLLLLSDLASRSSSSNNASEKSTEKGLTWENRADLQYKT